MALTASKNLVEKYDPTATREDFVATNSTQYFKGGLVGLVAGVLVKLTQATAACNSVWVCEDEFLTTTAAKNIGVRSGIFKFINGDTIVAADIGKRAFIGAAGDDTAFKGGDPITDVCIGVIEGVDASTATGGAGVWVKVPGFREIMKPLDATHGDNLSGS
jgi:hypothetical protein